MTTKAGRPREYRNNAEKQRAYRQRLANHQVNSVMKLQLPDVRLLRSGMLLEPGERVYCPHLGLRGEVAWISANHWSIGFRSDTGTESFMTICDVYRIS